MSIDLRTSKALIRKEALARRAALTPAEVQTRSAAIADTVCALPIFASARCICSYLAIDHEVETRGIISAALQTGKDVVLPRVVHHDTLMLHAISSLEGLTPGPYGILQPAPDLPPVLPHEVDLFLTPGVAFDAAGHRLGYGAGYYDRLLSHPGGWRVGLAFSRQVLPCVPSCAEDQPMDLLVTEDGVIDCRQGQRAGDHLRMRNMIFYGYHGAFPSEREQGIRLAVDVDLRLDLQLPGQSDELTATVNYPAIYQLITRIQSSHEYHLFEALVEHIAAGVLDAFPAVAEVTVAARKFNPPIGGLMDAFEVEITRTRPVWMRG